MPTRVEAVREQERLFGARATLPEICMALRMGVNGSADEWDPGDIRAAVAMLKFRLETWKPGAERVRAVDDAVRRLVLATVREVEGYDWWQQA